MTVQYFDWAATSPISERALSAYTESARTYRGNPSSLHEDGRAAARFLTMQRQASARLLGVQPQQICYTSGATEANAIIMQSLLWRRQPGKVILSSLEHDSILQYRRLLETYGFEVVIVGAPKGYVDPKEIAANLDERTQMICLLLVSNVLGTVQDIASVSSLLARHRQETGRRVHLHCDAVQAIGKITFDLDKLGVDSASFSAHKFQGPRGTGMLYLGTSTVEALSRGGAQEQGIRPGTEHVAAIAAMNVALEDALAQEQEHLLRARRIRRAFERRLEDHAGLMLLSPSVDSGLAATPYICSVAAQGVPSEVLTRILYDMGYCVSSGSACSNNAPGKKHGLLVSAGFSPSLASSAIRVSFGPDTAEDEIIGLADAIGTEAGKLKKITRKR